jgi:hypothetical protein
MVVHNEQEGTWKEAIAAQFKFPSWHLPARTVENHGFSLSGLSAYRPGFEPNTFRIEIGKVIAEASFVHHEEASSAMLRKRRKTKKREGTKRTENKNKKIHAIERRVTNGET